MPPFVPKPESDLPPESDPVEDADTDILPLPESCGDTQDDDVLDLAEGPFANGRAAILNASRHAPAGPGVYRMIADDGTVLYVGKAKNIKKRVLSYTRPVGHTQRIARMIAATVAMEFVSTRTEPEALLLEANLIKQLKPRFNVLLRDDKSFPYILITADHAAPQLLKHRGARSRPGQYYGPFASVWAVDRTINALQRAFLLRSCSDSYYENRSRPCLMFQIKRCAGPCTGEIAPQDYETLVREAQNFLTGRSKAVKEQLAHEMEQAAEVLEFERAARLRDRLAALSAVQASQGINPRSVEEADVFACHQDGGATCIEVFFFRTGQNWGNRAYYPRADRSLSAAEVLGPFLSQFYEDKPCPRMVLLSHPVDDQALIAEALSEKTGTKVEVVHPKRGEKKDLVDHALQNAREALGRKLSESATQARLLDGLATVLRLSAPPRRIEVYDNSHISGAHAVGALIVSGPDGFMKSQYRTFNIKSADLTPGDDHGMMREVLKRRFSRLLKEAPRTTDPGKGEDGPHGSVPDLAVAWPDLVLIDGGQGQVNAARAVMADLGVSDIAVVGIAKGLDREAGREQFFVSGLPPFRMEPRDPVLYFIQRLRDEAHRFAIGTHRARRRKDITDAGLQAIPGVGPTRKRALLRHFGTLKAIERASLFDLEQVDGINASTAQAIYGYFHEQKSS